MTNKLKIIGRECRFALHIPVTKKNPEDLHLIKEMIHLEDGTCKPNLRLCKGYKRPFYVVKPQFRTYQQKKEKESMDKLQEFWCTQSDLRNRIANIIGKDFSSDSIRDLQSNPYIYGSDISSTSLIKMSYMNKYKDFNTPYSVAYLDIETSMLSKHREIIMNSILYNNELYTFIDKKVLKGYSDPIGLINLGINKYLSEYVAKYNLKYNIVICDDEISIVRETFKILHQWKPDFLAIWNMDFDVPKIIAACNRHNVNPKDIFSDPCIPDDIKYFKYHQGKKKKITASGKAWPIVPSSQWHSVYCLSSFTIIDGMCIYKRVRVGDPELPSYKLDRILEKELKARKLSNVIEHGKGLLGATWHRYMQSNYIIDYTIYNMFDVIGFMELENKNKDMSIKFPLYSNITDFKNFNLSTKLMADSLHIECLSNGSMIASVGSTLEEEEDYDDKVLNLRNWIVTLPAQHISRNGYKCILEFPDHPTNVYTFTSDADAVSAYPSGITVLNQSMETTVREIITIFGVPEKVFRRQNMNLLSGPTNALEYSRNMFNFPSLPHLLHLYRN